MEHAGLTKRLSSHAFINNLDLMYDSLEELNEVSVELQKRDINIISTHSTIYSEVRVFEAMTEQPEHTTQPETIHENTFKGVSLHEGKPDNKKLLQQDFLSCVEYEKSTVIIRRTFIRANRTQQSH